MMIAFNDGIERLNAPRAVVLRMILDRKIPHPRRVHVWTETEFVEVQAAVAAKKKESTNETNV